MKDEIKEILEDFKNIVENNSHFEVRGQIYKPLLDYITNLQEEIENKNNEIDVLKDQDVRPFKEYKEMIQDMSKENMIKGLYDLSANCIEKDKEISRLNNIINELSYGIKELDNMFYETFRISQNGYYSISEWELKDFTNKLKELKGGNNEKM